MSESEDQVKEKKKSSMGVIGIIFILLIAILGAGLYNKAQKSKVSVDMHSSESVDHDHPLDTATESTNTNKEDVKDLKEADSANAVVETAKEETSFNLEASSKPRILGNPDAPIKISEHSSFTCGHCANFHKTNFKKIKADYVDTGKAYIIYNDFPLNGHDINIGAVTRCIPEESFFSFIQLLFETQKDWLKEGYLDNVKQNAQLTGASHAQINECLNSDELREALAKQREDAVAKHGVHATPTLVINDNVVIPGLSPYSEIQKELDNELEKASK